jgi:hypothetical protein
MANGLRGVMKNLVRKTQKLYRVLIFAQLLIKQKLKKTMNLKSGCIWGTTMETITIKHNKLTG